MSKTSKILKALENGQSLTPAQIRGTYKLSNPYDPIMRLRRDGHCIYTTDRTLTDGRTVKTYKMGVPTQEMVVAAAHLFNRMFHI